MIISKTVGYAIRSVMRLIQSSYADPVKAGDISISQNIPEAYLFKLLGRLNNAGIIKSRRGINGGYYLAKKPSEITISDILKATDNSINSSKCLLTDNECGGTETCTIHNVWAKSNIKIEKVLSKISLEVLEESFKFEELEPETVESDYH